jgi:GNAT superfamily N-acetyltransferase
VTEVSMRAMTADVADLRLIADIFERNGSPRDAQSLEWQYLTNPVGRVWSDLAVAGQNAGAARLAALYATLPSHVCAGGRSRIALQSLDTLTDAEFRGRGLFGQLAQSTFARAERDGLAFVYGFPNKHSAPGFFGKLGWTSLDPLPFLIRPLRVRYGLARLGLGRLSGVVPDVALARGASRSAIDGCVLHEVDRFDEGFTRLWSTFATGIGFGVQRSAAYLNWRVADRPGQNYQRFAFFDGSEPVGLVIFGWQDKHGGRVGTVLELLYSPGRARLGRRLLSLAMGMLAEQGADVALAWSLPRSPNFLTFIASGFVPLPTALRPVELHFGARAFDPALASSIGDRARWYISYLDSDTT